MPIRNRRRKAVKKAAPKKVAAPKKTKTAPKKAKTAPKKAAHKVEAAEKDE